MKKMNLDWLMENLFSIYHEDLKLIRKWEEPYLSTETSPNIDYIHGGFITHYVNERWWGILVVDKEKFRKVRKMILKESRWGEALTVHVKHLYKYELDFLRTAICPWNLGIKDEFVENLKEFLDRELYYWFDNFGRQGCNYESKYRGRMRKETDAYTVPEYLK